MRLWRALFAPLSVPLESGLGRTCHPTPLLSRELFSVPGVSSDTSSKRDNANPTPQHDGSWFVAQMDAR